MLVLRSIFLFLCHFKLLHFTFSKTVFRSKLVRQQCVEEGKALGGSSGFASGC